jgi:two-component system, cell cycle sensor histidine kinase and response regulator CckA
MITGFRSLRLAGTVALLLVVGSTVLAGWLLSSKRAVRLVEDQASRRAAVLAAAMVAQLEGTDGQSSIARSNIVNLIRKDDEWHAALLLDQNNNVLSSTDPSQEGRNIVRTPLVEHLPATLLFDAQSSTSNPSFSKDGFAAAILPVELKGAAAGTHFGSLLVVLDVRTSVAQALAEAEQAVAQQAGLLILLTLVFAWGAKRLVLDRIGALNAVTRKITKGDFSTEARLPGNDEIARLSQSLDQLAAWVENSSAALRESERSYRELVENSNDLIWSANAQGCWTFVNRQAALQIYGRRVEEMLGRPIAALADPGEEEENVIAFEQIDKGQRHIQFETIHRHKNGHSVHLSFSGIVHRDAQDQIEGISGIARDITRRKQAEDQVREQADLIDLARDAILVRDLEDRVLFWNRGSESLFGWTKNQAIGTRSTALVFKDVQAVGEAHRAVLEHGEWMGELRPVNKLGAEIIVNSRWTLVRDAAGRPKSILCIDTNITEQKQLEAQFLRVQRLEGIGTLAGGIAHDLNNVFSPITISLAVLKDKVNDPSAVKLLNILATSTKRGADIVKQLLTFARGTEGRMGLLQPAHLLKELVSLIKGTFPKNVHLTFNVPKDLWPVVGDATQLHQVLLNLCINARDAMPEGGRLTVRAEGLTLDDHFVRLQPEARPGPYVLLEVSDTGCGIPGAHLDRIFDPFFTTKEPGKGTGLGLSSALGIVRSHGGFITVKSTAGEGTTFKVYLPAQPSEAHAFAEGVAADVPRGDGRTVLVVDDEDVIRRATASVLTKFGYRVILAEDGRDAADIFRRGRSDIHLVISDLLMPGSDGLALLRAIREVDDEVPIIVSTGLTSENTWDQLDRLNVSTILEKPYTGEDLLLAIDTALNDGIAASPSSPVGSPSPDAQE